MTLAELVADLLAAEVRDQVAAGAVGVLVEVPQLEAASAIPALARLLDENLELRIAYLPEGGEETAGLSDGVFDNSIERAEAWRNERGLEATIVVVATGEEARLSSLREFVTITPASLKRRLAARACERFGEINDVQAAWWAQVGADTLISLTELADYFLALDGREDIDVVDRATDELPRIGLLPDPDLLNKRSQIERRVKTNREVRQRLQALSDSDRRLIQKSIAEESDAEKRASLQAGFRRIQELRQGKVHPFLDEAQRLLGMRKPATSSGSSGSSKNTKARVPSGAEAAAAAVVDGEEKELEPVLANLGEQLSGLDESTLKPVRLGLPAPGREDTDGEVQVQARTDLVNLMGRVTGADAYGGLVGASGDSVEEMVRRFAGDADVRRTWNLELAEEILSASEREGIVAVRSLLAAYAEARKQVLPLTRSLSVAPLLVAGSPPARAQLQELVDRYQELITGINQHHGDLVAEFAGDADTLIGEILKLDIILFESEERTVALLTSVHPLYLWHYAEFCRIVEEQRERLAERDRDLIKDVAAQELPNFLSSVSLPPITAPAATVLPFVGRIGPIPYFASASERNNAPDGIVATERLLRAYLDVFPPASEGLRLTVLDAPDPSPYLLMLADFADEELISGAHLFCLRHPGEKVGTDLDLDAEEEERVAQRFTSAGEDRRFTFAVADVAEHRMLPPDTPAAHVLVAVDQTAGQPRRLQDFDQPLQPLVAARKLYYRTVGHRVELETAQGGPFASYFQMARQIGTTLGASDWDRHQDEALTRRLRDASRQAHWFVLADRRVDRDLDLDLLRIYTGTEGDRDVAAFARYADPFRRALREVAVQYNVAISAHQLDALLHDLAGLLDAGVLWLRTTADGTVNHSAVKGVLGTLIASRWWRQAAPPGHRRLVISLDDPAARKWLHLSEDPRRADLLGLDLGDGRLEVAAIEVKAVEASSSEYQISGGRIEGEAVDQVLSTRSLLCDVFGLGSGSDLVITPARRELLRANAFRELSKSSYDGEARRVWVETIEEALDEEVSVEVSAHLVDVRIGANPTTLPAPVSALAADDIPVLITVLNEREVDELQSPDPSTIAAIEAATEEPEGEGEDIDLSDESAEDGAGELKTAPDSGIGAEEKSQAAKPSKPSDRPYADLGSAQAAYGEIEEIAFDPVRPGEELPNAHISITGETGSGKTQATKAILHDLMGDFGLPGLILDFKDDYSQPSYAQAEALRIEDASFGGLPFNPLEPAIDPGSGRVNPMGHIHQVGEILKRVYRLGDQQTFHLREAIKESYSNRGLETSAHVPAEGISWPTLDDVRPIVAEGGNDALLGRLSPIFDLGLFTDPGDASLADLLDGRVVIRLSQLPGDQVKNAVAEFLLLALYNHLIRLEHPRGLKRILVLDEAWRVTNSERLEPLMRESRAFGLGIIIATQYPNDLTEVVSGATATRLFFSQSLADPIKSIQATLVGKSSGKEAEAVAAEMRSMKEMNCLMQNQQNRPYRRVAVKPYWQRVQ